RFIDLTRHILEMIAQRSCDAGEVCVIAEEDFFSYRVIELRRRTACTANNPQWVDRLAPGFVGTNEMIAPRLRAKVDGDLELLAVADSARPEMACGFDGFSNDRICTHTRAVNCNRHSRRRLRKIQGVAGLRVSGC